MYPTPRSLHFVVETYWSVRKPNAALLEVFTGHEPASVNGYVERARLFVCISLAREKKGTFLCANLSTRFAGRQEGSGR